MLTEVTSISFASETASYIGVVMVPSCRVFGWCRNFFKAFGPAKRRYDTIARKRILSALGWNVISADVS